MSTISTAYSEHNSNESFLNTKKHTLTFINYSSKTMANLDLDIKLLKESMCKIPNLNELYFEEKESPSENTISYIIDELNKVLQVNQNISEDLIELEYLGGGSFGNVVIVYDKINRIYLAKKTLKLTPNFFQICLIELRIIVEIIRLKIPDLLNFYKIKFKPDAFMEIYMERGMGTLEDLANFMAENKYKCDEMLEILKSDLLYQVETLAVNKISHFDIKPPNIIISSDFKIKLADFGASLVLDNPKLETNVLVRGTPSYMSAEMSKAFNNKDEFCTLIPFNSDLESLEKSIDYYKEIVANNTNEISYEELKKEFKYEMISKIYQRSDPQIQKKIRDLMFANKLLVELQIKLEKELKRTRDQNSKSLYEHEYYLLEGILEIKLEHNEYTSAIEIFNQVIKMAEEIWGPDPIRLEIFYQKLGRACCITFKYKESEFYLKKYLAIVSKVHGKQSFQYIYSLMQIGNSLMFTNNISDAIKTLAEALELIEEQNQNDHAIKAEILSNLGRSYSFMRNFEYAFDYYNKAEAMFTRLGMESENPVFMLLTFQGHTYIARDASEQIHVDFKEIKDLSRPPNLEDAFKIFQKYYEVRKKYYGDMEYIGVLANNFLGRVRRLEGKYQESLAFLLKGNELLCKIFGPKNHEIVTNLEGLSITYVMMEKYDQAFEVASQGLQINKDLGIEVHPSIGNLCDSMSMVYRARKDFEKAIEYNKKAKKIRKIIKNPDDIILSTENSVMIYMSKGDYFKAFNKILKAVERRTLSGYKQSDLFWHENRAKECIRVIAKGNNDKPDIAISLKYLILSEIFSKTKSKAKV